MSELGLHFNLRTMWFHVCTMGLLCTIHTSTHIYSGVLWFKHNPMIWSYHLVIVEKVILISFLKNLSPNNINVIHCGIPQNYKPFFVMININCHIHLFKVFWNGTGTFWQIVPHWLLIFPHNHLQLTKNVYPWTSTASWLVGCGDGGWGWR